MLTPYPTEAPTEAWQLVWDAIRNKEIPRTASTVHVGWNLAGFALGKVYPAGPIPVGAPPLTEHDEAAVNAAFAQLCQPDPKPVMVSAVAFPWALVLQAVLQWLANR